MKGSLKQIKLAEKFKAKRYEELKSVIEDMKKHLGEKKTREFTREFAEKMMEIDDSTWWIDNQYYSLNGLVRAFNRHGRSFDFRYDGRI